MPRKRIKQISKPVPRELRPLILAALTVARQILEDEAKQVRKPATPATAGGSR